MSRSKAKIDEQRRRLPREDRNFFILSTASFPCSVPDVDRSLLFFTFVTVSIMNRALELKSVSSARKTGTSRILRQRLLLPFRLLLNKPDDILETGGIIAPQLTAAAYRHQYHPIRRCPSRTSQDLQQTLNFPLSHDFLLPPTFHKAPNKIVNESRRDDSCVV